MGPLPSLSLNYPSFLSHICFSVFLLLSFSLLASHFVIVLLSSFHLFSKVHIPLVLLPSPPSPLCPSPLTLTLVLSSRKSLSTICLAVMNSASFGTNHLGQINETLRGDKLYVSVRACATENVYVPKMLHNPSTAPLNLSSDRQHATWKYVRNSFFFKEEVKNRGAPVFGHPHMLVRTLFTYSQIFQQRCKARVPSRTVKARKSFSPHWLWSVIVFHFFICCFYFVFSLCFQFSLSQSPAWVGLLSFAIVL